METAPWWLKPGQGFGRLCVVFLGLSTQKGSLTAVHFSICARNWEIEHLHAAIARLIISCSQEQDSASSVPRSNDQIRR